VIFIVSEEKTYYLNNEGKNSHGEKSPYNRNKKYLTYKVPLNHFSFLINILYEAYKFKTSFHEQSYTASTNRDYQIKGDRRATAAKGGV
jgi:hypothetical protein